MTERLDANGENWEVRLSRERPHEGVTAVIFRCMSNSSYGWRVVEVPVGEFETQEQLEGAGESELRRLFERSQPFDYAHDQKAREWSVGEGGARRSAATGEGVDAEPEAPTTK